MEEHNPPAPPCVDRAIDDDAPRPSEEEPTTDEQSLITDWTTDSNTSNDGESIQNVFPLLLLPMELLIMIMAYLPIAERWMLRVNKKLYEAEESRRWPAGEVCVGDVQYYTPSKNELCLWTEYCEEGASLVKMARNMDVKKLTLESYEEWAFPFVKKIPAETLYIFAFENDRLGGETEDASLEEWIGERKSLQIFGRIGLSGEKLFETFTDMECGRSSLQQLQFDGLPGPTPEASRKCLELLGLSWNNETGFKSTKPDLELFSMPEGVELEEDKYDDIGCPPPTRHLFAIIGWRGKIAFRKWIGTNQVVPPEERGEDIMYPYENEFSMECFDENGAPPSFAPTFGLTIADIRLKGDPIRVTYVSSAQ